MRTRQQLNIIKCSQRGKCQLSMYKAPTVTTGLTELPLSCCSSQRATPAAACIAGKLQRYPARLKRHIASRKRYCTPAMACRVTASLQLLGAQCLKLERPPIASVALRRKLILARNARRLARNARRLARNARNCHACCMDLKRAVCATMYAGACVLVAAALFG